ncbi:MAG: class I SAM-dependent methyltransferase, partial [Myxococcota bacterium]
VPALLDAGCGTGIHYALFAQRFGHVVGLDLSEPMLRHARARNPTGSFVHGDLRDASRFDAGTFTHIASMYGATFYVERFDLVIANYAYWLAPGGKLFLSAYKPSEISRSNAPLARSIEAPRPGLVTGRQAITDYGNFQTRSWWELFDWKHRAIYHEHIEFDDGRSLVKRHEMYAPPFETLATIARSNALALIDIVPIVDDGEYILVFRKTDDLEAHELDSLESMSGLFDSEYSAIYDSLEGHARYDEELRLLRARLKSADSPRTTEAARILDAGCGTGRHASALAEHAQVVCLDASQSMLARAARRAPKATRVLGSFTDPELFEPASFDGVYSTYASTFYARDHRGVLENYHRWLKPGGWLVLSVFDRGKLAPPTRVDEGADREAGHWKSSRVGTYHYDEKVRISSGRKIARKHTLFLPELDELTDGLDTEGFDIIERRPSGTVSFETLIVARKRSAIEALP